MTERRLIKASEAQRRPLLNLGSGDRRGLERAFQALVGPANSPEAAALEVLRRLGFLRYEQGEAVLLSHPLAPDRRVPFLLAEPIPAEFEAESWALEFAAHHFPEMEFYLPYISLRAARQKRLTVQSGPVRRLSPEPEYDEDGFLSEYS
jgi:hypothetical protein